MTRHELWRALKGIRDYEIYPLLTRAEDLMKTVEDADEKERLEEIIEKCQNVIMAI